MQCSLCMCPLKFSLFLTKIFLPCEGNLHYKRKHIKVRGNKKQGTKLVAMRCNSYPLLNDKIPGPPTKSIADEELNEIKWNVEDDVVKPDYTSPTPSNSFNSRKFPVCIDCNQSSNLHIIKICFSGFHLQYIMFRS